MERKNNYTRGGLSKEDLFKEIVLNPLLAQRELNRRSYFEFFQYFWPVVSSNKFQPNWHIRFLCEELELIADRVLNKEPKLHDLIINISPGSTKTLLVSVMFPAWCWAHKAHWMRFITASYSIQLSLESAELCRDLLRSTRFQEMYPDIVIRDDKDVKSNYKIAKRITQNTGRNSAHALTYGGRYTTSVGGTLMGFHADILIVDDPLNPTQAASEIEINNANRWMEQTLPTRKTNKDITPTILVMQRLHQDDPAGHLLLKQKENIRHICFPGEIRHFRQNVKPPEMTRFYIDDLFDPVRMPWSVLEELEADLGQYGYAGQIGQDPTPPGGGMFKVDHFSVISTMPSVGNIVKTVRYWDKAGTKDAGAYTVGVKMSLLLSGKWIIEDVKRGRWGSEEREQIIRNVAEADGKQVQIYLEQEPGSSGKESVEGSIRNLAGFQAYADRPTGDKIARADPFSVQVNSGNVMLLNGNWHREFVEELRFFPYSTYKDQVDAASGAFSHLVQKKFAKQII